MDAASEHDEEGQVRFHIFYAYSYFLCVSSKKESNPIVLIDSILRTEFSSLCAAFSEDVCTNIPREAEKKKADIQTVRQTVRKTM